MWRDRVERVLAIVAVALPLGTVASLPFLPSVRPAPVVFSGGSIHPLSERRFERLPLPLRGEEQQLPQFTNVQVIDVDGDGRDEVLACDGLGHRVVRIDHDAGGSPVETTLATDVRVPAHATVVDLDGDGDRDLVLAVLGDIHPSDKAVGRVEWLENTASGYVRHVILDDVRRVADVQPGDFDADGDVDLAVAVFGYSRGEVLWLENLGAGRFADHRLHCGAGAIHVPVADYDGDGDLDIATVMSQEDEEVWGFENLGGGQFRPTMLWRSPNFDLGSAGLVAADLDQDGDVDLVLPVGDNLEDFDAFPQPYHGCLWLENQGGWRFVEHRIATLGGTYAAAVGDLDGDGDPDVALVSMDNDWRDPRTASLVWLENQGGGEFRTWQVDTSPIHLVTVAIGDIDHDGQADIVAGSLNIRRPYDRIGGVTAWLGREAKR